MIGAVAVVLVAGGLKALLSLRYPDVDWFTFAPLVQRTISFVILVLVSCRVSGARGFGGAGHVYVAATLVAVVVRARVL